MLGKTKTQKHSGFTMIEILIVLVIVAILAAIAYPSYLNQMRRSNRAEAQSFLLDLTNRQQQYLMDARTYANTVAKLGTSTPAAVSRYYTITEPFPTATATAFTMQAVPIVGTTQEPDYTLSVDQDGVKKANGSVNPSIW